MKFARKKKLRSDLYPLGSVDGFTIIEAVVAIAVSSFLILVIYSVLNVSHQQELMTRRRQGLDVVRALINSTLANEASFESTKLNNAASFACIDQHFDCTGQGGRITLYSGSASPAPLLEAGDAANPSTGLTPGGALCNTFNATPGAGSAACPFQFQVRWDPICDVSPCIDPRIRMTADLKANPDPHDLRINVSTQALSLQVNRANLPLSRNPSCVMLGGTWDGTSCTMVSMSVLGCPDFMIGIGPAPNGGSICTSETSPGVTARYCNPGDAVSSVDANGNISCATMTPEQIPVPGAPVPTPFPVPTPASPIPVPFPFPVPTPVPIPVPVPVPTPSGGT